MSTVLCGGLLKGRVLLAPEGESTRPTSNKIRQALFNVAGQNFSGVDFIDVYAGCGSVGFEALSRGAASCLFVENDKNAVDCIRENAKQLQLENKIQVVSIDALDFLESLSEDQSKAFLFIDPPFKPEFPKLDNVLPKLSTEFVIQFPTQLKTEPWLDAANKVKKYGVSSLAFFDQEK